MNTDRINYNGELLRPEELGFSADTLRSTNYLYQKIHTRSHSGLHLDDHIEIINSAIKAITGSTIELDSNKLNSEIKELLSVNRFPKMGNEVTLYVYSTDLRGGENRPSYILETTSQLYYHRYTVWHKRLMLDIFPCDYLYMGYPTGIARMVSGYSQDFAQRNSCDVAVVENFDKQLTNINDEPLFILIGREIFTSPCAMGATDTVMRRQIFKACEKERITIKEQPLSREMLLSCDEVFSLSVQGVVSIAGYGEARYFNIMAQRLADTIDSFVI